MTRRNACFLLAAAGSLVLFRNTLGPLLNFAFHSDTYSYILVVPLISAGLIYLERKKIFHDVRYGWTSGLAVVLCAAALFGFAKRHAGAFPQDNDSALAILAMVAFWAGLFVLCFGGRALQAALFPLMFLLLMIPLPAWLHAESVYVLRKGSAHTAAVTLNLLGVPVYEDGLRLSLPKINIDVAEQCSSIRSSLALLITALLISHIFLRSIWSKLCACAAVFPITIFKNGLRIVTLSFLLVHPSITSFTTTFHHHAGIPFSLLAMALLVPLIWALRQIENRPAKKTPPPISR